jgi:hypothetical protein
MAKRIPLHQVPNNRPVDDILADIKSLYFKTSAATIDRDFDRAIDLLKSIPLPADRQRATVYMEGLAEMRKDWQKKPGRRR